MNDTDADAEEIPVSEWSLFDQEREVERNQAHADRLMAQAHFWEKYFVTSKLAHLASYIEAGGDIDPTEEKGGEKINDVRSVVVAALRGEAKSPDKRTNKWGDLEFYIAVAEMTDDPAINTLDKVFDKTPLGIGIGWDGFEKKYKRGLRFARSIGAVVKRKG